MIYHGTAHIRVLRPLELIFILKRFCIDPTQVEKTFVWQKAMNVVIRASLISQFRETEKIEVKYESQVPLFIYEVMKRVV